jgi:CheY-like chemotaxis protein
MLVLDDDPSRVKSLRRQFPNAEIVWAETVTECIGFLDQQWDVIRLDHDLGGETFVDSSRDDCGMEVVRDLAAHPRPHLRETVMIVHSRNGLAGPAMVAMLRRAGYDAAYSPFKHA